MVRSSAQHTPPDRESGVERSPGAPAGFPLPGPAQHAVSTSFTRVERHRDAVVRHWRGRYRELTGRDWTPHELDLAPRVLDRVHRALIRRDFRAYTSAIEEVA